MRGPCEGVLDVAGGVFKVQVLRGGGRHVLRPGVVWWAVLGCVW